MKFVDKKFKRTAFLPILTYQAAATLDRRDARRIRRRPIEAAVVMAERLLAAQPRNDS